MQMSSNIEIKARVSNPDRLWTLAGALSDIPPVRIEQRDTYFACPHGRLKLRQINHSDAQLIFYRRPDACLPKQSNYHISTIGDPENLLAVLGNAIGIQATIIKTRMLFVVGQTRIHLDDVDGLGSFVELEVVLRDTQPPEEGISIARELMKDFGIEENDLIAGSYLDLILQN